MRLEVLVSMLNGDPKKFVKKAKIDSDAVVINQCNEEKYEEFRHNGHVIRVWHTKERGIGRSRNMALKKSTADIVLFADDDEVFAPDYQKRLISAFEKNRKMDFAVCNLDIVDSGDRPIAKRERGIKRIHRWNSFKYGACRFVVKRNFLKRNDINFDERFGASVYAHGEDSVFIQDCVANRANVYTVPESVAKCSRGSSTWFNGFNEKYYYDTGAIFARSFGKIAIFVLVPFLVRKRVRTKDIRVAVEGLRKFNRGDG